MRHRRYSHITLLTVGVALFAGLLYADTMYWDSNFDDINLDPINNLADVVFDSAAATLVMDSHCELTADNTTAAQLSEVGGEDDLRRQRPLRHRPVNC